MNALDRLAAELEASYLGRSIEDMVRQWPTDPLSWKTDWRRVARRAIALLGAKTGKASR